MKVLEAGRVDQGAGKGSDEGEEEEKIEAGSLGSMIKRERESREGVVAPEGGGEPGGRVVTGPKRSLARPRKSPGL